MTAPARIFLDTNVYIVGFGAPGTAEEAILKWAGFRQPSPGPVELIISDALLKQVIRVGRRLFGKQWGSAALRRLWVFQYHYVVIDAELVKAVIEKNEIPREDASIYITAKIGEAQCFVSANHELIRAIAEKTSDFECLTPDDFVQKYLSNEGETKG